MKKIGIFYWSGTGNTESMANAMADGLKEAEVEYDLINISTANASVSDYEKLMFGCPSMGVEELEESEFEPFFQEAQKSISGKDVALFGSYGWGDGEWMRTWQDRVNDANANLYEDEGMIVNEEPDASALEKCKAYSKAFAQS
ncbi:flavodoxin [Peptostreptococcus equinus]|uniref:Flavodoxin n=1 Tax=Peptostreptococcus equinus TaxID=3003601 RepID=A0ABY7JP96_9FIRM|nr:flavodoxin [Peptostreptococcus sp. CBA3647]WAW15190.1 flavodoxin [Peptostreptococcus sp. CBA3647]